MSMHYYLSRNYKGNRAKKDIEEIVSANGYLNAGLKQPRSQNLIIDFFSTLLGVLKIPFSLGAGDRLLLQYPLKKYFAFACKLAHLRNAKVIVIIHDLGSFRRKKLSIDQEIKRLSCADYIVAHNNKMKKWLEDQGCKRPIGELGLFDYLSDSNLQDHKEIIPPYKIVYAGVLSRRKNSFLYEIGEHLKTPCLCLYGRGFEIDQAKGKENIEYKGFIPSDQLISSVEGDFGLVWDGASIDSCVGNFGEYLRYNNPHKTSLYLRCGLPVIIWKDAALAEFIEGNDVGFSVSSLSDIHLVLESLSTERYFQMKKNAIEIGRKLQEGYFIGRALREANQVLDELNTKI